MKIPEPLQQVDRTYVRLNGRKISYFAGCDYFRLASHPRVLRAAATALKKYGLNVAASRFTTGNHELFGQLETALAKYFEAEAAVLVSNGYVTNIVAAQALAGEFSYGLIDEKAHPSLRDAAQILGVPTATFRHRDPVDLIRVLEKLPALARPILLTDGMFSHDGSIAPLKRYLEILPTSSFVLLDDAHAAGTLGKSGKGVIELDNLSRGRVIQTVTLSKAFGCYGGAILCSNVFRERILAKSRMLIGNTPLPLPLANAALTAIGLLARDKNLRRRLNENVTTVKRALRKAGLEVVESPSPILAIVPKTEVEAELIKAGCAKNKIFPSFIKYPGGPANGFFRFVLSSEHSKGQLKALVQSLSV